MTCYEIWSLIISAIGAIATFSAVIVALWQTKYANKKKIKLIYSESVAMVQNLITGEVESPSYKYVQISITNIGNRKIIIKNWFIYFSKEFALQIVDKNGKTMPLTLDIEENSILRTTFIGIKQALIKNKKEIEKYKNDNLMFSIFDSTGKKYLIKSNKKINDILNTDDLEFVIS